MVRPVAAAVALLLSAGVQWPIGSLADTASEQPTQTISADDLAAVADLDGMTISPDGRWAAFQVRRPVPDQNRYQMDWYVAPTAGGQARRLADAGNPILPTVAGERFNGFISAPPPIWSQDSRWLVYLRKEAGRTQLWRADRQFSRVEQLTHAAGDVNNAVFSRDGSKLFFEMRMSREQMDAALAEESQSGALFDERFYATYSQNPVAPSRDILQSATSLWAYDLANDQQRQATEQERQEFTTLRQPLRSAPPNSLPPLAARSANGLLAWTEARDPDQQGVIPPMTIVARLHGADAPTICTAAACASQRFKGLWWRNEQELIFLRREGPSSADTALYAWRPQDGTLRLILRTPDLLAEPPLNGTCDIGQGQLICISESPSYPDRLIAIDLDTGTREVLYDPNPDFARFNLGPAPQRIDVRTPSGAETFGYLVLPPSGRAHERLPLIIVTYRCSGFLRGGTGNEYPIFPFAAERFAVLCLDLPTFDDSKLARLSIEDYDAWARGPGDPIKHRVQDCIDSAVQQLAAAGIIDPNRVGLTGLSFGAEAVNFAMFRMPTLAAAIASGGEIGPSSAYFYSEGGRSSLRAWGLGSPFSERWRALSLTLNAERARAPLLLNVPDRELLFALPVVVALEDAERPVEMHVFQNEYHIKWQPQHRLAIYQRNIDWMNFWIMGREDANPAKQSQYERWRAIRHNLTTNLSAATPGTN